MLEILMAFVGSIVCYLCIHQTLKLLLKLRMILPALAGAQIPVDEVPSVQKEIVFKGRELGKPVIVASHLLQSMIDNPIPTRAEV